MATPWRRLTTVGWSVGIAIVVAVLIAFGVLGPLQRVITPVFAPIGRFAHRAVERFSTYTDRRSSVQELQRENDNLTQQLVQAQLDRASLNQQLTELKLLREESNFLKRRTLAGVAARVIGRAEVSAQLLLVDVGSANGIRAGMPVLANGGVLIGVVSDVSDTTSNVRLLTADGSNVGARIDQQDGPSGILVGEQGTGIRLTLVPKNEALHERQTVVTSDVNPQIPSGLLVGTISTISATAGALFQDATIIPTVPYERLNVLTILQ